MDTVDLERALCQAIPLAEAARLTFFLRRFVFQGKVCNADEMRLQRTRERLSESKLSESTFLVGTL